MNHTKKTMKRGGILIAVLISLAVILTACGSGGGGSSSAFGGGTSGTGVVVEGIVTDKGSVTVNDIRYVAGTGAFTSRDDNPGTESDIDIGMFVLLKGTRNDDGTGKYERIEAEDELEGPVDTGSIDPVNMRFTVLNQYVYVTDETVWRNAPGKFADIFAGTFVEVHGQRDADDKIRASRVEIINPEPAEVELKGTVELLDSVLGIFDICSGGNIVAKLCSRVQTTPGTTTFAPNPPIASIIDISDGDRVEVKGTTAAPNIINATRVEVEDEEDNEFEPRDGLEVEFEGFIKSVSTDTPVVGTDTVELDVAGRIVTVLVERATVIFIGGGAEDLDVDVKIEVEGHFDATLTLIAEKLKFKHSRIRLEADASASTASTLTVYGLTFNIIPELTDLSSATNCRALSERCEVRGFEDLSGSFIAERIRDRGVTAPGSDDDYLSAVVGAKNEGADTLDILGITADLTAALDPAGYLDENDNAIGKAAFYGAITANRTVVKVKGPAPAYSAGPPKSFTADQGELEGE